jgi:DNA-directed RNA polymerase specialized sigma24 family protein
MSYKQISQVTGLSVTNVGFLLHVALKALRRRLAGEDAPGRRQAKCGT